MNGSASYGIAHSKPQKKRAPTYSLRLISQGIPYFIKIKKQNVNNPAAQCIEQILDSCTTMCEHIWIKLEERHHFLVSHHHLAKSMLTHP